MEEDVMGKILPNLTVTLSDCDEDDQIEEGEISNSSDVTGINISPDHSEKTKKSVDIVRTWMQSLQTPKSYENKNGAFVTGLDLSSEELKKKLEDRAERFGLEKNFTETVTQTEINDLYRSLDIDPDNLDLCKLRNIRLDALHMRGVDDMSTNDIFYYFKDYGPSSVEWINDCSCNVVWLDEATTARALLGTSQPYVEKKQSDSIQEFLDESPSMNEASIADYPMSIGQSDSEDSDRDDGRKAAGKTTKISINADKDAGNSDDASISSSPVDVPVPPGYWRLGNPSPKAKAILLRFASKDDKKLPGAEKRSHYYKKYGNPNYGGLKGLISGSRKRKMQAERNKKVIESITYKQDDDGLLTSEIKYVTPPATATSRNKMPRMRMYADEEETKMKTKSRSQSLSNKPRSVHSRLGKKYTSDELFHLGKRFSSDSEEAEEEDDVLINCTVPSRFNIWTDIAKSMAKEDRPKPSRSYKSSSFKGFDRRHEYSRDRRDIDSPGYSRDYEYSERREKYSAPRYGFNPNKRDRSRDRDDWNPHKKESRKTNRYISPLDRDDLPEKSEDLRSKIKRLKNESDVNKHRSPLCKDD